MAYCVPRTPFPYQLFSVLKGRMPQSLSVWLDQETEDKVAVGLTTTIAQEKFLYTCIVLSQISAILNCCMC